MISEFPLFLFTTLGGLAAGAYVVYAFLPSDLSGEGEANAKRPWLFPLACLVLLGVGLLGVLGHLGRPERFLLALANPTSMIAEEAYWSIAFGLLVLVDLVFLARKGTSPRVVRILAALCGFVLMCIMGWAYFTAYGNPAWAAWPTLPLFVIGDLAMGAALAGLFKGERYRKAVFAVAAAVLALLAAASMVAVSMQFAATGHDITPFTVAVVLAVASAAVTLLARANKLSVPAASGLTFICIFAGVVVARYTFYAASVL
ncbi:MULTISPECIES: DmsC/YnfH family molybdoenzyme membrane anchor subunit [Gordonibacter]|uniref:Dimethyl sulfoxide reductase anchor subunit n=1 Tax=Gordonibacter faecis TaxID=3047475 RepID=A0ABT7DNQ4_9ACTN|nr:MULTISPECIES: DmsC/YnfH family molybdoenzyme membrane anchor subunit [unclassified Gordonibacter]MDJ1651175.1 dimethyl sulfoxide reductase anchor subunit [Gordonibacter sp. KGMB12511]HIW77359.1 dimethyl sulfoxide reductase anchor subunit [Candidatus Gordonibacter avicola]